MKPGRTLFSCAAHQEAKAAIVCDDGGQAAAMIAAIDDAFAKLAASPLGMSDRWESKPSGGKPYLAAGRRGTIAYGTIGSWDELALLALLVNSWPTISAHLKARARRS